MPKDDKWVQGTLPARPSLRGDSRRKPSAALMQKVARAYNKNLVGRPLTAALHGPSPLRNGKSWAHGLFGVICLAMGLGLMVSGAIFTQLWVLVAGAGVVVIGGALLLRSRISRPQPLALVGDLNQEAKALDAYLNEISPYLPRSALASLARIKETLARILATFADGTTIIDASPEDQFFIREMVARYLPDACRHYLDVVRTADGHVPLENKRDVDESLCGQLDILHGRLEKMLVTIVAAKAQKLATHEAFIKTKQ